MAEIAYTEVAEYFKQKKPAPAPVYLIYGEELLCRSISRELRQWLLPDGADHNYEAFDESRDELSSLISNLNTYSLLGGPKVVAIVDTALLQPKKETPDLLEKARAAAEKKSIAKAARTLLRWLAAQGAQLDDLMAGSPFRKKIKADIEKSPPGWIEEALVYCQAKKLKVPGAEEDAAKLQRALETGFPSGHHLILTADAVHRRGTLFKTILTEGVVINCAIPKSGRKADQVIQRKVIDEMVRGVMEKSGKQIQPSALNRLIQQTGFDLATFTQNLDRLVAYCGDRKQIRLEDVAKTVSRTRKDPIFELTGAVAERNLGKALAVLDNLLSAEFHPLQLQAAIANQVRKLLAARCFLASPQVSRWRPSLNYQQFQKEVLPVVSEYDQALFDVLSNWQTQRTAVAKGGAPKKKGRAKKPTSDLLLHPKKRSPYPLFLLLGNAHRFTLAQLQDAMGHLVEADRLLKSSGQNPKLVVERLLVQICGLPPK